MVFFNKEIVSNKFIVGGAPVPFEVLDGNIGVIALEENDANKALIAELTKACGKFGISKLSEAEYTEKKTLPQPILGRSQERSQRNEKLRVVQTRTPTNPFGRQVGQAAPGGAAVEAKPATPPAAQPTAPVPAAPPAKAEGSPDSTSGTGMLPPKFTPATRRISRRTEGQPETTAAPGECQSLI